MTDSQQSQASLIAALIELKQRWNLAERALALRPTEELCQVALAVEFDATLVFLRSLGLEIPPTLLRAGGALVRVMRDQQPDALLVPEHTRHKLNLTGAMHDSASAQPKGVAAACLEILIRMKYGKKQAETDLAVAIRKYAKYRVEPGTIGSWRKKISEGVPVPWAPIYHEIMNQYISDGLIPMPESVIRAAAETFARVPASAGGNRRLR